MKTHNTNLSWHIGLAAAALMALAGSRAFAGGGTVIPPQADAFGKTYAEWGAAWWQWSLTLPLAGHPFYGCPADCGAGQSGKVWFL